MVLDYNKYPFMVSVDEVIKRENAVDLYTLLTTDGKAIREAKNRIREIVTGKEVKRLKEYTSPQLVFFAELLILGVLNDKRTTERVLRKEKDLFMRDLEREEDADLLTVFKWLGFNVKMSSLKYHEVTRGKVQPKRLDYSLHFLEYLKAIKGSKEFPLTQRILHKGYVYMDRSTLLKLLGFNLLKRLRETVKPIPMEEVPETLVDIIMMRGGKTPPCIRAIQEKRERSREEALALAVYMANTGSSVDSIALVLEKNGEENPMEQVKRIFKEKMVIYSCQRMKELGMCVSDCGTRSPLQFYYGSADITK
ncbi:DNA primase large subunit [Metallosphaera sedula]|uniref:DNA primase large subunit PriL n=3 Tax=Metallosphaera TaxID=41980 RepID=A4YI00_METS5|nr:DNA primase regulatory subunit PriL [Metallosphaera sedula]ABP96052.1 DNA primase large subunit [Metallosphaera sedula DSM 5348]QCO30536.1 DNA primase regulatory subunit PriL [Metallosphaera prunae]AIM28036.1 DNA primase large subunit [Metallosphaera sedula]AKV74869.1 DNA primase [Metallosphaera sedula]AKV77106.1 DNA primase [Metallosphaera sedula]